MNLNLKIFCVITLLAPISLWAAVPMNGTLGSNLTGYNGNMGATNNNNWNQYTNERTAPAADFGNCNALILRCAQPKCASGGCISMEIAYPIVSGCVMSNESCKKHGDTLTQTIAAQIVANATARANDAALSANASAAATAAATSDAQIQQMTAQMAQMQQQNADAAARSAAAMQSALDEQKQMTAAALADAMARNTTNESANTAAGQNNTSNAAAMGVSADVLAREQASGQIMTQLENAERALKELKTTMNTAFEYAGCDSNGNNCTGPKRVKVFKQKAGEFFDPYETVLDEVYDALIMAQSLGVDITDIYMMLNGSCNVWGKYMCETCTTGKDCDNGYYNVTKTKNANGDTKVDSKQEHCTLLNMISDNETVQQNWLDMDAGSSGGIRIACASDAIDNSTLFRGRKKQASIDIETLQRIIDQDAPSRPETGSNPLPLHRYCAVDDSDIQTLEILVQKKGLTTTGFGNVCVPLTNLKEKSQPSVNTPSGSETSNVAFKSNSAQYNFNLCMNATGTPTASGDCDCTNATDRLKCINFKQSNSEKTFKIAPINLSSFKQ